MTKHHALTDAIIRAAKPGKASQLTDGNGLYLKLFQGKGMVHFWRFDYKSPVTGKRNTLSFDAYPTVGLKLAREKAQEAREAIARGDDPAQARNAVKAEQAAVVTAIRVADERAQAFELATLDPKTGKPRFGASAAPGSLLGVAQDMFMSRSISQAWKPLHAAQWLGMITRCTPAHIAAMPIGEVKPAHMLAIVQGQEAEGKDATALTVRRFLADLFDYAERHEIRQGNPARAIRKDCKKAEHSDNIGNNPGAETPQALTLVLRAIANWANPITRAALQVQAALFQRPGDTCAMRWADVDLDGAEWRIPVQRRTKLFKSLPEGAEFHIVPLPAQVVQVLRGLKSMTGHSEWVFLSTANTGGPITNDTLTNALRSMGLGAVQTAHGFRATARTLGPVVCPGVMQPQYVEAQLAHSIGMQTVDGRMIRDPNGTAYARAVFLAERAPMLQAWADYLDSLLAADEAPALAGPLELLAA